MADTLEPLPIESPWQRASRWLVRSLILVIWLVVMAFPFVAFVLGTQGELNIGNDPNRHIRLFMLQEPDKFGVGVEWIRPSRRQANCTQGSINYWLWEGEGESVTFCQCFDPNDGAYLSSTQNACQAPG